MKAVFKDYSIADSEDIEEVNGIFYFPFDSVDRDLILENNNTVFLAEKGHVKYYHLIVDGEVIHNAICHYVDPISPLLSERVSFSKEIEMKESSSLINSYLLNVLNSFF